MVNAALDKGCRTAATGAEVDKGIGLKGGAKDREELCSKERCTRGALDYGNFERPQNCERCLDSFAKERREPATRQNKSWAKVEDVKEVATRPGHQSRTNDGALLEEALPAFNFGAVLRVEIPYTLQLLSIIEGILLYLARSEMINVV